MRGNRLVDIGNAAPLGRILFQPLEAASRPQLAAFGFQVLQIEIGHAPLWPHRRALASGYGGCRRGADLPPRSVFVATPPVAFLGDTLERLAIRFDIHELPRLGRAFLAIALGPFACCPLSSASCASRSPPTSRPQHPPLDRDFGPSLCGGLGHKRYSGSEMLRCDNGWRGGRCLIYRRCSAGVKIVTSESLAWVNRQGNLCILLLSTCDLCQKGS